ncbi:hypothetical protein C8J56DRAFT_1163726 [Mycena floridula]|nr:hypothetical protein C8J56DRAFT_1163726 [Mycena floridula]
MAISLDFQAPHLSAVSYSPRCLDDALWGVSVARSAAGTLRSLEWAEDTGLANLAAIFLISPKFSTNVLLIVHPNLQTLQCLMNYLEDADWNDVLQKMMNSLTIPALVDVSAEVIHGRYSDPTIWPQEAFLWMLQRSYCSVTDLSLVGQNLKRLWFHFSESIY